MNWPPGWRISRVGAMGGKWWPWDGPANMARNSGAEGLGWIGRNGGAGGVDLGGWEVGDEYVCPWG
jgi:hypothetical protein